MASSTGSAARDLAVCAPHGGTGKSRRVEPLGHAAIDAGMRATRVHPSGFDTSIRKALGQKQRRADSVDPG